jgi:lipopolysaccharide heptosyltransferase II
MVTHNRILVVRTDRIGDVVLATPLIRALRQTFPDAFIAAMVRPYTRAVLENNPNLNQIIEDDYEGRDAARKGFWRQVKRIRDYRFDTALLLLPTERAAWMLFFAGINYRITTSMRLYTVLTGMRSVLRHKYNPPRHEADYCLDLGRRIGVLSEDLTTEIFLSEEERRKGKDILAAHGVQGGDRLLGIHPGSGRSSPNWPVERYAELAARFADHKNLKIILTGSEQEAHFWQYFERLRAQNVINLIGKLTLRELISVISHYDCLLSPSTGPMHIAAALKVPTVSLFTPLPSCSPILWGPKGNRSEIVLPPEGFCQVKCEVDPKKCTLGGIEVETALRAILRVLESCGKS